MTERIAGGPVLETTVGGVLRDAAERAAGTVALVEGVADQGARRRWSYADLLADSERVARALLGRFAPGERVAVWAPNSPEWLLTEFGAALAGLTLVTVNPALRAGEVAHVLGQSRAQGLVLAPAYRGTDLTQTEASPSITQSRLDDSPDDRAETLGRAHPHVGVAIADPVTGQHLPAGTIGEIVTRGYHVMQGYFENPAATREAIDDEGWLHTGDLGSADERGYYRIEGRLKEMIIRGGENIYPREIEQVLQAHPGVADVAVVGVPDDHWGEQVAAFVRAAPGHDVSQDELTAWCRARLAAHKTPRHWVFVDAFPLTASGKVQKFVLREGFGGGA